MHDCTIDLIIPVYKNKELTEKCITSLIANLEEIKYLSPRIILINDSPDDNEVSTFLFEFAEKEKNVFLLVNEENLGFVKSVNKGLALAKKDHRSAILINSDTITFPGTLIELIDAAYTDPQIGFACPRSNNAALSTMPRPPHNLGGVSVTPEQTYNNWQIISRLMPKVSYSPTATGFYLFIKKEVIANFGQLNEDFNLGYEEENDLIMRANKVGYRAILANHSFAFHSGSASFLLQDMDVAQEKNKNLQKITLMHPEFLPLVAKYERSPEFIAEDLLKNLIRSREGKLPIAIDLSRMGVHQNGSSELAVAIISEISKNFAHKFELTLFCTKKVFEFHGFNRLKNVRRTESITGSYAIAINLGQPFELDQINILESLAPINIYGMLDVIAHDCGYLYLQHDIDKYWRYVSQFANGIFFISKFSELTYQNRFHGSASAKRYTKLLPTKLSEYKTPYKNVSGGEKHIFVFGNHFKHKDSDATAKRIADKLSSCSVVVMGAEDFSHGNLRSYRAGTIGNEVMVELLAEASLIVLPSYYEGFGLGLMHALALEKPIVARDIPATREILATYSYVKGVVLYQNNDDIVDVIQHSIHLTSSNVGDSTASTWQDWVREFMFFCDELIHSPLIYRQAVERIYAGNNLRETAQLKNLLKDGPSKTIYSVKGLLSLENESFVTAAYRQILQRDCDRHGLTFYLDRLRNGYKKIDILTDIKYSDEGRRVNALFPGVGKLKRSKMLKNLFSLKIL
ncbi:MAG: glycosyl transferase group 1 family protein [Solimicrobium sp.]|jgi:GT2 family glycosyltransferase/glycosyltransferase involved in cell wall biosynthesis|nr:glycosyl transferase group 1 family protein [Solimicrobium sp.]